MEFWLVIATGLGLLVFAAFAMRRRPQSSPPSVSTPAKDILAEADDAEFARAVRPRPAPASLPEEEEEEEALEWEERSEVYAPARTSLQIVRQATGVLGASEPPDAEPMIWIRKSAWRAVWEHLGGDEKRERGGLVLGRAFLLSETENYLILIEEALPAPDGIETATSFSYTSATWQALFPRLQSLSEDQTILGSYHSHPNMGVFLSKTDLDTQAGVFPHPWQVAIVIDPVRHEEAVFFGIEGTVAEYWTLIDAAAPT